MKKLLKIMGSTLLFLLFIIVALYFITFSPIGSSIFKPYIKKELEEKIGMPIDINTFDLEYGTANLEFSINKQALVNMEVSQYDLLNDTFEGIYHITTEKFIYENKKLNKLDIKGSFKYLPEDLFVEGEGTAFNGKVDYHLNIIDNLPQQVLLNIKDAQFSEVLQLVGQPDIAQGKIDVKVNIPDMCGDRKNIYGYIDLKKSYFKPARVKELYDITLPEKSYLYGRVDGKLEGGNVKLVGGVQSNLFTLEIKSALVNMFADQWTAEYRLDAKDMRILTENKLVGPLKLDGEIEGDGKWIHVKSRRNSLGEELRFSTWTGSENFKITFEKLALDSFLSLIKQPDYAKGELSGTVVYDYMVVKHDIRIDKGMLTRKAIKKISPYNIPEKSTFSLETKGKIINKSLTANATVYSTLADVEFTDMKYDFEGKLLVSDYTLLLHDINALVPKSKAAKGAPLTAEGQFKLTNTFSISGETKSLGKKVAFSYDCKRAKLDASELLPALAGVPLSCQP